MFWRNGGGTGRASDETPSYESDFNDFVDSPDCRSTADVQGTVVRDDESLWDVRVPVALRLLKITRPSEPKPDRRGSAASPARADEQKRTADKSQQQTSARHLTRPATTSKSGCPNVAVVRCAATAVIDRHVSKISNAVSTLVDRLLETYADFAVDGKSARCVHVLAGTARLVRMLCRLLKDLRRAARDGDIVCRYDALVDDYDACLKTYHEIRRHAAACKQERDDRCHRYALRSVVDYYTRNAYSRYI